MDVVGPIADAEGATVVLGVNVDDLGDHRPGQRAASERGAAFPLVAAGLHQGRRPRRCRAPLGLRTWDKPAAACLASRVPYGTPVTFRTLTRRRPGRGGLRRLGFRQVRVRHYDDPARIEVDLAELAAVVERREEVVRAVRRARLPLRHARPRGVPLRQPERRAARATVRAMKLGMAINYSGDFKEAVEQAVNLEKAGLDVVWVAEAYSFDAISQVGYLAAKTERVQIGTGILNVYSRTPALMAMTAAGCDYVSDGRFILGLGASGPQVIEGFHGVPYEKPMTRIVEYIEACRMVWRREPFVFHGQAIEAPLPARQGHRARQAAQADQPPGARATSRSSGPA